MFHSAKVRRSPLIASKKKKKDDNKLSPEGLSTYMAKLLEDLRDGTKRATRPLGFK